MRWTALAVALLMITSGCLGGSADEGQEDVEATSSSEEAAANASRAGSANATPGNASSNATYLKNNDYNETHVHDYWPGESTERILMDETVSTDTMFSVFYTAFSPVIDEPKTGVGTVWFTLPNATFVPIGTGKLTVEVDATGALEGQQALSYQAANSDTYTEMDPQGAQATWEIQLEPEMADLPHAKSTRWSFQLEAEGAGSMLDGDINVKITAHKLFELESWPEHPDFWDKGQETKRHLFTLDEDFAHLGPWWAEYFTGEDESKNIHPPQGALVPPETEILVVRMWYALGSAATNSVNGDVRLVVQEGSSSSYFESLWDERVDQREGDGQGFKMYAIPVDGQSWDSPYADQSDWVYRVYAPTGVRDPQTGQPQAMLGLSEAGSGNVTIDATAYRVVPPWLQDLIHRNDEDDHRSREAAALP